MASSTVKPMPQTIEAYKTLAQRDLELIMEMKAIIGKQNKELNTLKQSNERLSKVILDVRKRDAGNKCLCRGNNTN